MTTPFCSDCNNTGEDAHSGWLACRAPGCAAAADRAALGAHLLALGPLTPYDREWEAYKLGQAKGASFWKPLTDVQWMNIVNHERAWAQYDKESAVHEAVKMVEAKLREINALAPANNKPEAAA